LTSIISNLENVALKNAATGRKKYFDLYPVTFEEFLEARGLHKEAGCLHGFSLKDPEAGGAITAYFHEKLATEFNVYLRLGGMPRIVDTYIESAGQSSILPERISDLVTTIEDNVKAVLGERSKLYEYDEILRRLAHLSMDTLKFSKLQVNHAGRAEAKKLVNKTVGARVAHKVRLIDSEKDLSKYFLFDCGVLNYLLNGSDLLGSRITSQHLAIGYEAAIGNEIIASLPSRDDLFYWKSPRGAQVEYLLRSPLLAAIDVKTGTGDTRSLQSCALFEPKLDCIVRFGAQPPLVDRNFTAKITSLGLERKITLVNLPHYLGGRLRELLAEI